MQARRGEDIKSESGMWPGYDPALQGKTGISYRFGPPGTNNCKVKLAVANSMWPGLIFETSRSCKLWPNTLLFLQGCPTLHGVASCVDYCTAYMGAWAGVTALYERETRGTPRDLIQSRIVCLILYMWWGFKCHEEKLTNQRLNIFWSRNISYWIGTQYLHGVVIGTDCLTHAVHPSWRWWRERAPTTRGAQSLRYGSFELVQGWGSTDKTSAMMDE